MLPMCTIFCRALNIPTALIFLIAIKSGLKSWCCNNEAVMQMSAIDYRHVSFGFALEMIMLRSGILYTPD